MASMLAGLAGSEVWSMWTYPVIRAAGWQTVGPVYTCNQRWLLKVPSETVLAEKYLILHGVGEQNIKLFLTIKHLDMFRSYTHLVLAVGFRGHRGNPPSGQNHSPRCLSQTIMEGWTRKCLIETTKDCLGRSSRQLLSARSISGSPLRSLRQARWVDGSGSGGLIQEPAQVQELQRQIREPFASKINISTLQTAAKMLLEGSSATGMVGSNQTPLQASLGGSLEVYSL